MKSFLSDRTVILSHNGSNLESSVSLGCPQGGVLSPFLWVILIDDLLRLNFNFPFRLIAYADDLTVLTSHKDASIAAINLQSMCDSIVAWCGDSKLYINALKTIFMLFARKSFDKSGLNLIINSTNIAPSDEAVLLGFTLDFRLNWHAHVDAKCLAAKKSLLCSQKKPKGYLGRKPLNITFSLQLYGGANTFVRLLGVGLSSQNKSRY